jgi:hypothetical protein
MNFAGYIARQASWYLIEGISLGVSFVVPQAWFTIPPLLLRVLREISRVCVRRLQRLHIRGACNSGVLSYLLR